MFYTIPREFSLDDPSREQCRCRINRCISKVSIFVSENRMFGIDIQPHLLEISNMEGRGCKFGRFDQSIKYVFSGTMVHSTAESMMDICQKMLIGVADDGKVTDFLSFRLNGGAVESSYFIRRSKFAARF